MVAEKTDQVDCESPESLPGAGGKARPDAAGAAVAPVAGEPPCSDEAAPDADGSPCLGAGGAAGAGALATGKAGVCCCHHKETPRSTAFQADLQKRLNRAIGQLGGVKGMLDDNRYCGDVLVQLAAAESAIHNVSAMLLQDHLETCVVEQVQRGNTEVIDEVMQLIKRFSR